MFRISNREFPDLSSSPRRTVLIVRTFKPLELNSLNSSPLGTFQTENPDLEIKVYFPSTFYIKFKNRDLAIEGTRALNSLRPGPRLGQMGVTLDASIMTSSHGFRQVNGKVPKSSLMAKKELLCKTLEEHELGSGEEKRCLLILGSCLKQVIRGSSQVYVNRLKNVLKCKRFVCGNVAGCKFNHINDFDAYGLAYYDTEEEVKSALVVSLDIATINPSIFK